MSWEIWVYISSTPPKMCARLPGAVAAARGEAPGAQGGGAPGPALPPSPGRRHGATTGAEGRAGAELVYSTLVARHGVSSPAVWLRRAHNLGGWMRFTSRFPKDHWEILKIHEISWIFNENPSKSMKNHGF